ncbi:MAG: germination protein YpeB [Bacillota bacterium]
MKKYSKSIMGTFLVLIIVAGLATGLGIAVNRNKQYDTTLDSFYKKSYYEAIDTLSDTELKLAKINISADSSIQSSLLYDVATDCALVVNNLSDLSGQYDDMTTIISFINKLGDYCGYLASAIDNGTLSAEESNNLETLHELVTLLIENMSFSGSSLADGDSITGDITEGITLLSAVCEYFSSDEVSYPELIYDGPFSDTDTTGSAYVLSGLAEISEEEAQTALKNYFQSATEITKIGESSGTLASFIYSFMIDNEYCNAEITKQGGLLIEYSCYREITNPTLSNEECKGLAEDYATTLGYSNLTVVWVANSNSTVYVNLAYTQNDIIYYNDLIQIKIASDTGALLGIEATNYILNHTERDTLEINYTEADALAKISTKLEVETIRLAVIPYGNTERITYEIFGSYNDEYYFIYVCATENCELEIKRVTEQNGTFWTM